jgi:hypothetical protein
MFFICFCLNHFTCIDVNITKVLSVKQVRMHAVYDYLHNYVCNFGTCGNLHEDFQLSLCNEVRLMGFMGCIGEICSFFFFFFF